MGLTLAWAKQSRNLQTFDEATEKVIAERRNIWMNSGTEKGWRRRLKKHASPKIGEKRVNDITEDDVISVLQPLLDSKKLSMAKTLLIYIRLIMDWYEDEYKDDKFVNPVTRRVRRRVKRQKAPDPKPMRSVPYDKVRKALQAIRGYGGWPQPKLAQESQILTAARGTSPSAKRVGMKSTGTTRFGPVRQST